MDGLALCPFKLDKKWLILERENRPSSLLSSLDAGHVIRHTRDQFYSCG